MANPTLNAAAASDDAQIRNHGAFTWAQLLAGTHGTKSVDTTSTDFMNFAYADGTAADRYVDRCLFTLDLSALPAGAVVLSARLRLYVTGKTTGAGGSLGVTGSTHASPPTTADWTNVGSTEYATRVNFSSLTNGAYNDLTFNAAGLSAIQAAAGGTLKIATRSSFDIDASGPGASVYSSAYGRMTDYSGTSSDPYLEVTYSTVRTGADALSFTDTSILAVDEADGDRLRWATDTLAFTDGGQGFQRNATPILLRAEGANTTLSGTQAGNSATITVTSTTGFASSGQFGIVDYTSATYYQEIITYTGKTGTTFTGCTGGTSHSFPGTTSLVGALDAHSNFPQVVPLDTTTAPPLLCSYKQGFWHGDTEAALKGKISLNGGATWGTEFAIMECVQAGRGMGLHNILRLADGTYFMVWQEWGHDYGAANALACYTSRGTYNPTAQTFSWDTPVRIPSAFTKDDMACGSDVVEFGGEIYVPVYGLDTGGRWDDVPQVQYCKLLKTTDKGATTGNWSTVSTMATLAQCDGRASGEPSLMILNDGTWLAQFRCEVKAPTYTALDRYQATSTDDGVTWSGHTRIIQNIGNMPAAHLMPEGHVVTQGQDLIYGGQTITYISVDQGGTFPYYRQEATDGTYSVGNGSDFRTVLRGATDSGDARQVVNAYAQERSSQGGSQTKFQWYAVPNFPIRTGTDTLAFTDTATRTATFDRTGADTLAFTDAATRVLTLPGTGADTLSLSDTATSQRVALRDAADALAWTDAGARTSSTASKTGADTVTFTDAGSGTAFTTSAITIHPQGMVPGTAIAAYLRWEWRGPVAAKLNAGPGAAVAETTVSSGLTATFTLAPGEYVAYSPAYPTKRLFFMVTE